MAQLQISPYVSELIIEAIKAEYADMNYYKELSQKLPNTEDSAILKDISLDDAKHAEMLKDMYYRITGEKLSEDIKGDIIPIGNSILAEYAKSLLDKLSKSEEYRKILFAFLNQEVRDTMTEIITDEQNHAAKLNYLYTKKLNTQ